MPTSGAERGSQQRGQRQHPGYTVEVPDWKQNQPINVDGIQVATGYGNGSTSQRDAFWRNGSISNSNWRRHRVRA